jgi:FkbM family methyltransferase
VRPHIDEAAYLYGLSRGLAERAGVTWFLLRKKAAQLADRIGRRAPDGRDASIELYGSRHTVDLMGSEIYVLDEIYRERLYDRLDDFVPAAGSTVVDVGANVGMFAVQQARRQARVLAFEPNPACYRRLSRTVVQNGLTDRIQALNYAVGASTGVGTLRVPDNRTMLGTIVDDGDGAWTDASVVAITTLDQVLPALGVAHVDLLKIDAEGAEVDVLRGASRTLEHTDRLILEYHSRGLREQVSALIGDRGFEQALHVDTPAPYLPEAGMIYARRAGVGSAAPPS